jgi:hypothetical protein
VKVAASWCKHNEITAAHCASSACRPACLPRLASDMEGTMARNLQADRVLTIATVASRARPTRSRTRTQRTNEWADQ